MMRPFRHLLGRAWLRRRDVLTLAGNAVLAGTSLAHPADREGGASAGAEVWVSYFRDKNVWGYVNRHSVSPGEAFELMLSTAPGKPDATGRIEFFRIEASAVNGGQTLVWQSPAIRVSNQQVLRTAPAIGVNWPPALSAIATADWPPGYYSADFVDTVTGVRDLQIAQIVVLNPRRSGQVLLKLCTNTYQ